MHILITDIHITSANYYILKFTLTYATIIDLWWFAVVFYTVKIFSMIEPVNRILG